MYWDTRQSQKLTCDVGTAGLGELYVHQAAVGCVDPLVVAHLSVKRVAPRKRSADTLQFVAAAAAAAVAAVVHYKRNT